jgi:hypothetical protein
MATADIAKEAVFDGRIVQNPPRYAVDKGGLSLTNSPYNAISATSSQHTYNINVPSQNVFVDRAIDFSTGVQVKFFVTVAGAPVVNAPVIVPGRDFALSSHPLHSLIGTMTATINDTSVTINTDTVLREVLRLTDYAKNRLSRTCPTQLDRYHYGGDAFDGVNNPGADFASQTAADERPNGAWFDLEFVNPNDGSSLAAVANYVNTGAVGVVAGSPANVTVISGIPVQSGAQAGSAYLVGIQFRCVEKLVLSPFIFADSAEWETGLFGINNIQIVLNMKANLDRLFRITPPTDATTLVAGVPTALKVIVPASVQYVSASPFLTPRMNVQYITPSLDIPLPSKSVVPYMEFPRYLTNATISAAPFQSATVQSQTIVLPQIPDMLLIYAKPTQYAVVGEPEWYFPIERISVNFDNFAGLLSSHSREQLYQMSVHNGLDMDFDEWSGRAIKSGRFAGGVVQAGYPSQYRIATVGGFLVLKPGQDITLQAGQAAGLIGNFTLQYQVDLVNASYEQRTNFAITLFTIAINSGFFETVAGSSRIVKGVLSEADIISAPPAPEGTGEAMKRLVGHGIMDRLGSFLSKAKASYTAAKPVLSAIKEALPAEGRAGQVKSALGMAGMGMAGGGPAGGRKSLSARLM